MQHFRHDDLKFTYSPLHTPIGTVQPGEVFQIDTEDCFTGRFRDPRDWNAENLRWVLENLDGVTGPLAVAGATPNDIVEITLHDVVPTTPGSIATSPCDDPTPSDWWGQWDGCGSYPIVNGHVVFSDSIRVPVRPLIGCIATAPDRETVLSKMQGRWGGNMDCNEIRAGATITLPVNTPGALIYFGDAKAAMGDGEIVQAPEIGTTITASVNVRARPPELQWPRVTTAEELVTVVSATTLDRAVGLAFAELLAWIVAGTGMPREQVALLLAMVANTGVCQTANSLHTGKCTVRRDAIPAFDLGS